MTVSDFTRRICAGLVLDKVAAAEIARLEDKAKILEQRPLTSREQERDDERRAEAGRLLQIAQDTIAETAEPQSPPPGPGPAAQSYNQLVLDAWDDLDRSSRQQRRARKHAVERAARERL